MQLKGSLQQQCNWLMIQIQILLWKSKSLQENLVFDQRSLMLIMHWPFQLSLTIALCIIGAFHDVTHHAMFCCFSASLYHLSRDDIENQAQEKNVTEQQRRYAMLTIPTILQYYSSLLNGWTSVYMYLPYWLTDWLMDRPTNQPPQMSPALWLILLCSHNDVVNIISGKLFLLHWMPWKTT